MTGKGADKNWALDREIVLSRVFDAPRETVFRMFTEKEHVTKWWCPKGFTCETLAIDVRVGGQWRFTYTAPDGKVWDNRVTYLQIEAPSLLVFDHGSDKDDDPGAFHVTITLDAQSDGKTVVTLRQLHPSKAQRDAGVGFGAVEIGYGTLDNLADRLAAMKASAAISR
jgi:uncharacterized protein YndB with AHSA1/START domain